ncbi:MAG: hypothetical protein IJM53_07585 [Lachnospiraceae bacterium]|nr:hypothetical protein [Lachnospiraceae bacterium]
MRTSEERVKELHYRMDIKKRSKALRRYMLQCAAACAFCAAVIIIIIIAVSKTPIQYQITGNSGASASIFAGNAVLGYVIIALVAFCLGALVTVFCYRMRKHLEGKYNDRKH